MLTVSVFVLVAVCSAQPVTKEWIQFVHYVHSYGKPYVNDSEVMEYKYNAFLVSVGHLCMHVGYILLHVSVYMFQHT